LDRKNWVARRGKDIIGGEGVGRTCGCNLKNSCIKKKLSSKRKWTDERKQGIKWRVLQEKGREICRKGRTEKGREKFVFGGVEKEKGDQSIRA